jgi:hypothetical protein
MMLDAMLEKERRKNAALRERLEHPTPDMLDEAWKVWNKWKNKPSTINQRIAFIEAIQAACRASLKEIK